ncbi:hypothetical protein C5167_017858 [Papaver somniferum]|uniref:Uncharacterized protein n=1 Tax=Papaver somniferum TaxID=3469 RepID=A0A4Y7IPK8_PAPSO|nr:hypothetical protein C5167_017858 [Papaver somniferum]
MNLRSLNLCQAELNYDWCIRKDWSANKIVVSLGYLQAGLHIPLYDHAAPLLYEILSKMKPQHGMC